MQETDFFVTTEKISNHKNESYFKAIKAESNKFVKRTTKSVINDLITRVKNDIQIEKFDQVTYEQQKERLKKSIGAKCLEKFDQEYYNKKIEEYMKIGENVKENIKTLKNYAKDLKNKRNKTNSPRKGLFYIEDSKEYEEQKAKAEEFVKRMKKERIERQARQKEKLHSLLEIQTKEMEKKRLELEKKEQEIKEKRRQRTERVYLEAKEKKRQANELFKERFKKSNNNSTNYLYKRLEEKYQIEVILPSIEKKKQELALHRNLYKPINWDEINKHQEEFDMRTNETSEERTKDLRERKAHEDFFHKLLRRMENKSSFKRAIMDLKEKEEHELKLKRRKELNTKRRNYSAIIKEMVQIKPSPKKAEELRLAISRLKQPVREQRDTRKAYDLSLLNNRSTKYKDKIHGSIIETKAPESVKSAARKNITFIIKETVKPKVKVMDYLAEKRIKRQSVEPPKRRFIDWEKEGKLDTQEKCNQLLERALRIEEKAQRKQELLNIKGDNPIANEGIADMLIESIEAKLAILNRTCNKLCG